MTDSVSMLLQAPSILIGLAVTLFTYFLLETIYAARPEWANNSHEAQRRDQLRKVSKLYHFLEPLIDDMVRLRRALSTGSVKIPLSDEDVKSVERNLKVAKSYPPWTGEEHLAVTMLEGVLGAALLYAILFLVADPLDAILVSLAGGWFWNYLRHNDLARTGGDYVNAVKRLMPYSIDLLALQMRAGAGFPEAVNTVVQENPDHPLGKELGEVMREVSIGHSRAQALERFKVRMADPDIGELIFSINKGEELGTPLTTILRNQADQMRLKRTQMVEKAAGAAQVKMMGPVMLIMLACLILMSGSIIGPSVGPGSTP